ncbi:MAG: TIGR04211 family SH3 domain-containing protein [Desulfuromonadales bacterium]|nr:TIGR04211 family SH3 domain-containing protein [Desulfuromonadales bacterium]
MKLYLYPVLVTILCLVGTFSAIADTRYISDHLIVTVRSGEGNQYKILETLPTSTPVTILEEGKSYVKVLTPKGVEGYVMRNYVTTTIPKKTQIKLLNKKIVALQQQLTDQQQNLQGNQEDMDNHKKQIEELEVQLNQSRQELKKTTSSYNSLLNKSENVLNINAENQHLIEENNLVNSEILILREENQNFHRSNMIQWFLAGGGVFFGGWLIGKISRKKHRRF